MPTTDNQRPGQLLANRRIVVRSPGSLALIYGVFAAAWILVSDRLVGWALAQSPGLQGYAQSVKGLAFVALTAFLLFLLLRRGSRRLDAAEDALELERIEQEAERSRIEICTALASEARTAG